LGYGTFADYLVVGVDARMTRKPAELSFEQAAVLPLAGGAAGDRRLAGGGGRHRRQVACRHQRRSLGKRPRAVLDLYPVEWPSQRLRSARFR
jgi:hypothetical protein